MTHGPLTLQDLTGEHTPAPAGIAVTEDVLTATLALAVERYEVLRCWSCKQGIVPWAAAGVPYRYEPGQIESLVTAHMIQRHGWTREVPGV